MRFRDFLLTFLVSVLATVLTVQLLITIEYIPTQRFYTLRQEVSKTVQASYDPVAETFYVSEKVPVSNVSGHAVLRILYAHLKFNITYNSKGELFTVGFSLVDKKANVNVITDQRSTRNFGVLSLEKILEVDGVYLIVFSTTKSYGFTVAYELVVIQTIY